jgi:tripartite-type tricarboxylate transporter receptor subunit TctC
MIVRRQYSDGIRKAINKQREESMGFKLKRHCVSIAALIAVGLVSSPVAAEKYPSKPIRLVVPFAPSGAADTTARMIAQGLSAALGKQVVVDNRPGGGGNIGAEIVSKALSDGYTLFLGGTAQTVAVSMYTKLNYDLTKDLIAISQVTTTPLIVTVHPALEAKSARDLIALAKLRPSRVTFSSAGIGSGLHLAGALFCEMGGIKMIHVPFKGGVLGLAAVMNGDVSVGFSAVTAAAPHVKSGKLRAVGVTGAERSQTLPEIPTVSEAGLPGYEAALWYGINAPQRTPEQIVSLLHSQVVAVLADPDVKKRLTAADLKPVGSTPREYDAYMRSEIAKWAKVIKAAGIKPE